MTHKNFQKNKRNSCLKINACLRSRKRDLSLTGFTLIELLLVVIVLAVLAGINIPNLKKTHSRLKLENCALNILSIGRYARQKAITQSLTQRLNFDLINNTYYLSQENDNDPEEFERIQGRFSGIFKIPQEILLESSAQFIDFYPDGDCDNVSIALSNSDNLRYKLIKSGVFGEFKIEKQKDARLSAY